MKPTPTPDAPAAGLRLRPLALGFLAMVALSLVALSREFSATATLRAQDTAPAYVADGPLSGGQYVHYPEEMFATDWAARVPLSDRLDLGRLHKACMRFKDSIVPWNIGGGRIPHERAVINESDPNLLTRLKQCADVDIFVPGGLRNNGYCEDAAAYTKYLRARMLPYWVKTVQVFDPAVGRKVGYHDLCPTTPMVFFNHYWEDMPDDPSWPREKHMVLMPNLEMHELQAEHYWRPDYVLCKTAVCARYLKDWYKQHGNPRQTRVVYTRHTSTDVSSIVRAALPLDEIAPKNFVEPSIIHTAGTSIQKGSMHVFDCWLGRPDLPPIDMYMAQDLFDGWFKKKYSKRLEKASNVRLHLGKMDEVAFGHLIAESSIFVCSSLQEGYGHYINQARASGGLILTPDVPPMNELITPSSGVLMEARGVGNEHQFFGGNGKHPLALRNVTGFIARFGGDDVCEAVDLAMKQLTAEERQQRAERAQQQYFFDTVFFARAMEDLKRDLGVHSAAPRLRNTP